MGIQIDKPIFNLIRQDVARVMVETEGFEMAADFPTDVLVNILNTIEDGLEYLYWYSNIQNSLLLAEQTSLHAKPADTEDGHLESDFETGFQGRMGRMLSMSYNYEHRRLVPRRQKVRRCLLH